VQLTWRERAAIVWDAGTLRQRGGFRYAGEGWGLCYDGRNLVQSDGSSRLTFRDPLTFAVRRRVGVTLVGRAGAPLGLAPGPVSQLNELECRGGKVYANVWRTDAILVVDPGDGNVKAVIDGSGLPRPRSDAEDVLNGIAFDPDRRTFLLTGKRWPWLYRVRLVPS
jgi:glutaminyl-peptide cyclotransferase